LVRQNLILTKSHYGKITFQQSLISAKFHKAKSVPVINFIARRTLSVVPKRLGLQHM
jgi:hypothetical protein